MTTFDNSDEAHVALRSVRCPDNPSPYDIDTGAITGCGLTFTAAPDGEGLFDCPGCGLFFNPDREEDDE